MKKIFCILCAVFLLLPALAFSQTWHNTNQATVAWDAVTYDITTGERIMYRTYLANANSDPEKLNPALLGDTPELLYTITLTSKGSYFFGCRSLVQVLGHDGVTWEDVSESEIGWSDDPTYAQAGETFGLRFYPAPPVPGGQRPVTE